ncbi:MAG: ABC transporter permease [Propioniciclava sp.]|uniref:ABC transporter permease n=1 Tax=Propioniciclava sp. TaxID=2038686 RepID=UPI0039E72261
MTNRHPIAATVAVLGYVIMIVPIFFVVAIAFNEGSTLSFPPTGLSLHWFAAALTYQRFTDGLVMSLIVALTSTALGLLLGVPAALALARSRFKGRAAVQQLFFSPLIIPELVLGAALYQQLAIPLRLQNYLPVLILGHTILMLPYAVRVTGAALANLDGQAEEAARMLGASPVRAFFDITLPLLRPGIFSAALLSFITSFNNVPLSLLLTKGSSTLPIAMLDYVAQGIDPMIAAMSTLILLGTIVIAFIAERTVGFAQIFGGINR